VILILTLLQTSMLVDVGGSNIEEFVKLTMKFLLTDDLTRQFNLSGRNKRSFSGLSLFEVLFSKLCILLNYNNCRFDNINICRWAANAVK
jgi:hypothetical protein